MSRFMCIPAILVTTLLLAACAGAPAATTAPTRTESPTPTPAPSSTAAPATTTPTPEPPTATSMAGPGTPVANQDWKMTVEGAHWEMSLDTGRYKPPRGFIYLVVDVTFSNLPSAAETEFDENDIIVLVDNLPLHDDLLMVKPEGDGYNVNAQGEIVKVDGSGSGTDFDLEGRNVYSFVDDPVQQRSMVFIFRIITYVNFSRNWRITLKDLPPAYFTPAPFTGNCAPNCNIDIDEWFCFEQHCVPRDEAKDLQEP